LVQGKLLELERELAGVMSLRDMSGTVLDKVQQLMGASGSTLFSFDEGGSVSTQGGSLEGAMSRYSPDLFPEDAMQQWSLRLPGSTFISDGAEHPEGKKFDFPAHAKTRPYADFYRPLDIAFVMGIWPTGLAYGSAQMFGLLLTRPPPFRPFGKRQLDQLRYLETPFRLAARRIAQFSALEQRADVLGQLPTLQAGALALWDVEGRLVWASAKAQRHLESKLRRGDLERAAQLALRQLRPRPAVGQTLLGRQRRLRSADGPPMLVAFSSIAGPDQRPWLLAEIEEASGAASPLSALTSAETRVLRLLVQGLSNAEIAEQLLVAKETVKTHLKRVFVKLGVSSRARAARIAADVWSAHSWPRRDRA
jgi:DNA-binding CsgD family transcriptional regulator